LKTERSKEALVSEISGLRREVAGLKREKADLELFIELSEYSDDIERYSVNEFESARRRLLLKLIKLRREVSELRKKMAQLEREKADLELLIETSTEHSDDMVEDLFNKVESTLRDSEKRFRLITETIPVPIIMTRLADDHIVYANEPAGSLLGIRAEALTSRKFSDFFSSDDRKFLSEILTVQEYVSDYEISGKRADQTDFWAVLFIRPLAFNNEPCLLSAIHDLTQRKKTEEELLHLATAIEQVAEGIVITEKNGTIRYVNPAFERIMEYSREDISGRNFRHLDNTEHPEAFYKTVWETISAGNVWTGHIITYKKSGEVCELEITISPIRDNSDEISSFVTVTRDVTHEIQMEKQLRQAQKMEAIGTLAGGIAHDFNNILFPIMGYTQMTMKLVSENPKAKRYLEHVFKAAERAKDLVRQILTFSRRNEHKRYPLKLQPIIKESLKLLRASVPATIHLAQNIDKNCGYVLADPISVHQIVMNLCTNAYHAMREKGGILELTLKEAEIDHEMLISNPGLKPGQYVCLTVSDTGHGISPEFMDKIFEPFFTTKKTGEGTGMGLSVVIGIVKNHGGHIVADSIPGKGSTFHVWLPRIEANTAQAAMTASEHLPKGNERILLADDEKLIVDMMQQMLESLGYQVTARTGSKEILELFRDRSQAYDLVITDMTMPNMTGLELSKELMGIRRDIPIILCTGFSETISEEIAKSFGIRGYLMKPVVMKELAETIRNCLKTPP
jgi:PAS domain S-box-containing protein